VIINRQGTLQQIPYFMSAPNTLKLIVTLLEKKVQSKEIMTPFVKSEYQLDDILTKGLSVKAFENILCKLVLYDIYHPSLRGSVEK
jgi:hypothetical protein